MQTKDFQKKCAEIVKAIDKKFKIKRDSYLGFMQFMEEVGELAKEINSSRLRKKKIDKDNLESEFADVFILLAFLADMHDVDFEKAVESKMKNLKERRYL